MDMAQRPLGPVERSARYWTGACCYRLPGPVRILNVLTGLFISPPNIDLLVGLCSIPHNIPD